jgi:hypothetical protein
LIGFLLAGKDISSYRASRKNKMAAQKLQEFSKLFDIYSLKRIKNAMKIPVTVYRSANRVLIVKLVKKVYFKKNNAERAKECLSLNTEKW